jgi:DNA-binding MurR/RpiR family transcriptional regulator
MDVTQRIGDAASSLTKSERRVAEIVIASPQLVAFGTVAELADVASAGAATVVRLAGKLGYDGFTGLQAAVQADLARQLRPAAERIREPATDDPLGQHLRLEVDNVHTTLAGIDPAEYRSAVDLLTDADRAVLVLSGDASTGVALQLVGELQALRDGVSLLGGNAVQVTRQIASISPGDVVVVLDLRRYDRWVVEALGRAQGRGAVVIALTDSLLSPLSASARCRFVVAAAGGGPFDSHTGTLAVCNLLVAGVASAMRDVAADRLERMEAAWREVDDLTDG